MVPSVWKTIYQLLKKLKIQLPYDSVIMLLGIYPREIKPYGCVKAFIWMFIEVLFAIIKNWKQTKRLSVDERWNKLWYIQTTKYHSVIKRNQLLIHATTCMNLQRIMLSERTPTLKGYILYYFFYTTFPRWQILEMD